MAYNGVDLVRLAQSGEEVDKSADKALANPVVYGSSLDCKLRETPTGNLLEVYGQLEQINPGSKVNLKYVFFLYEDYLEFEEEHTLHMTRAISPSAKGSSIRVTQGEVTNVKKEFSLDVIEVEENVGVLFAVFDADSNEIYTYSHWTLRSPHIVKAISKKHSPEKPITCEFDIDIDPETFSENTVLCVSSIGRPVKGTYNVSGKKCSFTPNDPLKKGSEYGFYLKGGKDGITSTTDVVMDNNLVCSFIAEESEEAILEIATEELDFGKLSEPRAQKVEIKNTGNAKLEGKAAVGMTWLKVDPMSISIDPGKSIEMNVTINPADLKEGFHNCNIIITTNGGDHTIPVSFQYIPIAAELKVSPETLDFGQVTVSKSKSMKLMFTADDTVKGTISATEGWISVNKESFEFANGEIEVIVKPTKVDDLKGELHIESNGGNFTILVTVSCVPEASIELVSETSNPTTNDQAELVIKLVPTDKKFNLYLNGKLVQENVETAANGEMRLYVDITPGNNTFKVESIGTDEIVTDEISITKQIILQLWIGKTNYTINGQTLTLDVAPTVSSPPLPAELKDNTYMPIRAVAEALGAEVGWVGAEKKVTLTQKKADGSTNFIELWINKKTAKVNGVETKLNDAGTLYPAIVSDRTMLPLRFVANNLGAEVGWDGAERKITLTYPK